MPVLLLIIKLRVLCEFAIVIANFTLERTEKVHWRPKIAYIYIVCHAVDGEREHLFMYVVQ